MDCHQLVLSTPGNRYGKRTVNGEVRPTGAIHRLKAGTPRLRRMAKCNVTGKPKCLPKGCAGTLSRYSGCL